MQTTNTTPVVKIFFTGTTGYIGGTVLDKLLHPSHTAKYQITALTRSADTVPKYQELGVTPLLGSLDDTDLLTKAASEADVVIHLADADHLPAAKAIAKALDTTSSNGKRKILIHCSGAGILNDGVRGAFAGQKVYNDLNVEEIHALPLTQIHRDVDTHIFDNSQNFDAIVVAPSTIHGIGTGPFKRISIQIPALIRGAVKTGHAGTIGKGLNIWNNVHVEDLAELFVLLLQKALEGKASTGREGFYFCENGEHQLKDVVARIGTELYNRKVISQAEPVEFTPEEVNHYLGEWAWLVIGSNSRGRSDRARGLGWRPVDGRDNIYESVAKEVEFVLAEGITSGQEKARA